MKKSLEQRFWEKVDKRGPDECWEWTACKTWGYGYIQDWSQQWKTHRLSWVLHHGAIPDGLCVCHHCDNRACVNPDHLFIGTIADNNRDMAAKGRYSKIGMIGEDNPRAKLSEKQVLEIRDLYTAGEISQREIADRYGVHQTAVGFIVRRVHWKHI